MIMELCINFAKFLKFKLQNEYESIDLSREYSNYVNDGSKDDDNKSESDKYFCNSNIVDFDKIYLFTKRVSRTRRDFYEDLLKKLGGARPVSSSPTSSS